MLDVEISQAITHELYFIWPVRAFRTKAQGPYPSTGTSVKIITNIFVFDSEKCHLATLYMSRRTWHAIKAVQ